MASPFAVLSQEHHDTMQAADKLLEGAIHEARPLTAEEQAQVDTYEARLDELDDILAPERKRRALRRREQAQDRQPDMLRGLDLRGAAEAAQRGRTIGSALLENPEFAAWRATFSANGVVRQGVHLESPRVEFGALAPLRLNPATAGGALVVPDQYGLVPFPQRPLSIRDLVTNGTTESNAIEYVRTTSTTNNAAPTAEAADITTGGVGVKPQSDMALQRVSTTVKTIAHWIAATRQALADAGQLRTLIDAFLLYGLEEELEDQMIAGDASGENFDGITHVAGTLTQAFTTTLLTTTRKARTNLRLNGRVTPTAYAFHPTDMEAIDLLQDNEARFYYGGPQAILTPRLWGYPVVESEAVPVGTAILANWRYAVLWDRQQGAILVSDSHSDFFIKNLLAILAEGRYAFGILRPQAFVKIALS